MVFIMEVEEQNQVRYVFANEATNIGTKFLPEQIVGKTVEEVFQSDYEMGSFILGKYQQVIQQRQSITYQHIFAASSGKTVYTETKLDPLINEEGKLTHIIAVIRDMTEFIQRQGEIQEKNALLEEIEYHYDSIIEHNTDAVWFIDKDGELVRANKTFRNLLGASTDIELRELKEMCIKVFEPEELEKVRSHQNKVMQGHPKEYESYFIHKNGERIDIRIKAVPVYIQGEVQGLYGFAKDITEQKRIEKELRESEERYRSLFHYNKDAVWSLDLEGNFTSANPAFENILRISPDSVCELNLKDFKDKMISPFEDGLKYFEEVLQGKSIEYDFSMYRADGEIVHLKITNVPIYVDGTITGVYGIGKDATEEFNAEEALRESEQRYRLIADNMNDLIVVYNLEGTVSYASPSYERVLGVKPEEYVGQHAACFIHKEDTPYVLSQFAEAIQQQSSFSVEFRKRNKAGKYLYFETLSMPVWNDEGELKEYVGVSRDITDRKYAEIALRESEERYRLIAENSYDLIRVINADLKIVYTSPSYQTVLGFTPEDMLEQDLFQEMHPEDVERIKGKLEELISTREPQLVEFRRKHKDGHWVWLESVGTLVLDKDGNTKHNVIVSRNISERKKTEELLKRAEKLAVIGQLSAAVAHEIRNPLTSVKGFIQLKEESIGKEIKDLLFSEIEQIERVVNEFLSFAKPQVPNYKQVDISMVVQQTLTIIEKQAIYKQIQLQTHLEKNLPAVFCDEQKIKQVLFNVIKNAMESMENKGKLFVQTQIRDAYVVIKVKDEGCGITKEKLSRLGEPFYSNKEKGTGLGLMVCFKIIEEHKGRIEVDSEVEKGTTVTIHLPIEGMNSIREN